MIRQLDLAAAERHLARLAEILIDCVENGASVGFMLPLPHSAAEAFWRGLLPAVQAGDTLLFGAIEGDLLLGTIQLRLAMPPNQQHRVDIAKLLVSVAARRRGIARALMAAAEAAAVARGRSLAVLDTIADSPAEPLYRSIGYQRAGLIPDYARMPDGPLAPTSVMWKRLS